MLRMSVNPTEGFFMVFVFINENASTVCCECFLPKPLFEENYCSDKKSFYQIKNHLFHIFKAIIYDLFLFLT